MQFNVPQFIEGDTKIVGPLSFKQFAYILVAGIISVLLYFTVSFALFLFLSIFILGLGFSLALLKVKGTSLPSLIKNFLIYLTKPKVYLWKKKTTPVKAQKKEVIEKEEEPKIKLIKKTSNLKKVLNKMQIK